MTRRNEEMWETAERKRFENCAVTEGVCRQNRETADKKAAINLIVAQTLLGGGSEAEAIKAAVAAGYDEFAARRCPAIDDADDPEMIAWYVERDGRS